MPSLRDVIPTGERVLVGGIEVEVFGLTGRAIAHLFARFPDVAKALTGQDISVSDIVAMGPNVVAAIIACGMRKIGDEDEESAVLDLTVGDQLDLLGPIVKQTMTKGVAPFLKVLSDMGLKAVPVSAPEGHGTAPDSNSPKPSKR